MGAKAGILPPLGLDESLYRCRVAVRGPEATYIRTLRVDAATLEPQVSVPTPWTAW
jgi:homoaconitase/3-isopropylmalate dehydratase large subunit